MALTNLFTDDWQPKHLCFRLYWLRLPITKVENKHMWEADVFLSQSDWMLIKLRQHRMFVRVFVNWNFLETKIWSP